MRNLLDEPIDHHERMDWTYGRKGVRTLFHGRKKGAANTIVRLIHRNTSGQIAPSQPDELTCSTTTIRPRQRMSVRPELNGLVQDVSRREVKVGCAGNTLAWPLDFGERPS